MNEQNTLKPCPFCDSDKVLRHEHARHDLPSTFAVQCHECGVKTRVYGTQAEADAAWNRREAESRLTAQVTELQSANTREVERRREAEAKVGEVMQSVIAEITRAVTKFPTWPTDPLHAVAVLGEEYGELQKAVLQHVYEPHKSTAADVREEAIQTAAMAIRFARSLDRYDYARCEQHSQGGAE
jgi:Lar family restriction alleviation protein